MASSEDHWNRMGFNASSQNQRTPISMTNLLSTHPVKMHERPLVSKTTVPPWLRHCYLVRIVDFKASKAARAFRNLDQSVDAVETALFVQLENKPISGLVYTVRPDRHARKFVHETTSCGDPKEEPDFDSDALIGYILKSDFEKAFPGILGSCPPPSVPPYEQFTQSDNPKHTNRLKLPLMESAD
ncbi:hypothetical protein QQZ08_000307 [Neonectria magnoliae]|uniref:Uncharacterized protein n=1 Tax=Neonectria magnoliae TaxID=2732573 RepID=A0ABR1ILV8_9HYPO